MAGGLIQIVTFGNQDIFLTGNPEITFFKVVYRRHTNFSIESIKVGFNNTVGFGNYCQLVVPKIGDLIYKTYIEVILPEINFFRNNICLADPIEIRLEKATKHFNNVKKFMKINREAFVQAHEIYIAENTTNCVSEMKRAIDHIFDAHDSQKIIKKFNKIMVTCDNKNLFFTKEINIKNVSSHFEHESDKDKFYKALTITIQKSGVIQNYYFNQYIKIKEELEDNINKHIKFAWVNRIGHAILDEIEIKIGGNKIDKQYGDWLNIWYELSGDRNLQEVYFKMIGNVNELTTFDRKPKPSYILRIPLQFWYCRYNGNALPLIALEYQDVTFHVKFKKLEEVAYIEEKTTIKYSKSDEGLYLEEVSEQMNINIDAYFLIDYIYLDSNERKIFAQSHHEYLIDQLQLFTEIVQQQKEQIILNNFVHPTKEIIWVAQKDTYITNKMGHTKCQWDNYSLTDIGVGNPISCTSIDFNSYNRVMKMNGNYFNYVQPYECHTSTPSDGINMYSFCFFPEASQPTGSANFSRISRIALYLEFDPYIFPVTLFVRIYARNLNILRFMNGLGGLAFVYG